MKKWVLMYSGGLDSYIAYWFLKRELEIDPLLVYVDLNHRYKDYELLAIRETKKYMKNPRIIYEQRLVMGDLEYENAYIPMRNSFLAHIGALHGDVIVITAQKGEMDLPDRSIEFYNKISELLSLLNERQIRVTPLFPEHTKTQIVQWYVKKGLPIEGLLATHSCYKKRNCGNCGACFRRWVSFSLNGIEEKYEVNPWETELAKQYLDKAKKLVYDGDRSDEIIEALRRKGVV